MSPETPSLTKKTSEQTSEVRANAVGDVRYSVLIAPLCTGTHHSLADRQTDRQAGRQTDRQTDRQIDRQTDRHTHPTTQTSHTHTHATH